MCDPMTLPGTFRKSTITDETTLGHGFRLEEWDWGSFNLQGEKG